MRFPGRVTRGTGAVALAAVCAACSAGASTLPAEAPPTPGPAVTYVALGGSETAGFDASDPQRQAWPLLVARALGPRTVLYDLAGPGSTAADAVATQLPAAEQVAPSVVTVWVGTGDIASGVTPAAFGAQLRDLLSSLRRTGAAVLIGDVPPLQDYPVSQECEAGDCPAPFGGVPDGAPLAALVASYNSAITAAAASSGATVVDVAGPLGKALGDGRAPASGSDYDLTTTGQAIVASAFTGPATARRG